MEEYLDKIKILIKECPDHKRQEMLAKLTDYIFDVQLKPIGD